MMLQNLIPNDLLNTFDLAVSIAKSFIKTL